MAFLNNATLTHIPEANVWVVQSPLVYLSSCFNLVVAVPAGFSTDLATIPRGLWYLLAPHDPDILEASVVHDYLYTRVTPDFTRGMADRLLELAMRDLGAPWWKCKLVYHAVRLFGSSHWVE